MYIAIEGIDGSGKSTLIKELSAQFTNALVVHEPGSTELSNHLRNILLHQRSDLEYNTQLLLMYASRSDLFNKIIIPTIDQDKTIISDRSSISSFAYQLYPLQQELKSKADKLDYNLMDFWTALNSFSQSNIYPDLVIFLRLEDPSVGLQRNNIIKEEDNFSKAGIDYYNLVAAGYDRIFKYLIVAAKEEKLAFADNLEFEFYEITETKQSPKFIAIIDASQSPEVIKSLATSTIGYVSLRIEQQLNDQLEQLEQANIQLEKEAAELNQVTEDQV